MLSDPNFKYSELHPNGPFPMFKEPEYFLPLQASVSYFFFFNLFGHAAWHAEP